MKVTRISVSDNVKSDRDYRATTGLSKDEFKSISEEFNRCYAPSILVGFPQGFGNDSIFQNPSDAPFFLLCHHKVSVTYDVIGLNFGIARATAHNAIALLKPILKAILTDENALPKRLFLTAEEVETYFSGVSDFLIDATKTPTQRPANTNSELSGRIVSLRYKLR